LLREEEDKLFVPIPMEFDEEVVERIDCAELDPFESIELRLLNALLNVLIEDGKELLMSTKRTCFGAWLRLICGLVESKSDTSDVVG